MGVGATAAVGLGATALARRKSKKAQRIVNRRSTGNLFNSTGQQDYSIIPKKMGHNILSPGAIVEIDFKDLNKSVALTPFVTTIIGKDAKSRVTIGQFVAHGPEGRGLIAYEVYGISADDVNDTVEKYREWSEKNNSPIGKFYKASTDLEDMSSKYIITLEAKQIELEQSLSLSDFTDEDRVNAEELLKTIKTAKAKAVDDLANLIESKKVLQ